MLAPGAVLADKYLVDRVIGQGGMATVVAATHLHLNEPVAIKMLLPELAQDATTVERFMREARAAARLKGEHVTRVHDVGVLPSGAPYIVMELLTGIDLGELLKARTVLAPHEGVDCALQVCEALAEAHAAGIVHRDIKPSNLFITKRPDGSPLVKVLDFGISKTHFDNQVSPLTQNAIVGTPSYMSPEQLRGLPTIDARSDIWSLGIVLYRLLAGHRPFKADSMSALAIQCATEPTPRFTVPVPTGLDTIVYRCLEKEPAHRYQSVAELAHAIAPYAGDQRAAQIAIERTQNILRWTPPPVIPRAVAQAGEPTTLGSSAAAIYPRPALGPRTGHARLLLIGSAASVTAIAAIVAITLVRGNRNTVGRPAAAPAAVAPAPIVEPIVEPIETPPPPGAAEPAPPTPGAPAGADEPDQTAGAAKLEPTEDEVEAKVEPKPKAMAKAKAEPRPKTKIEPKAKIDEPEVEPQAKPLEPAPKPKRNPLDSRM